MDWSNLKAFPDQKIKTCFGKGRKHCVKISTEEKKSTLPAIVMLAEYYLNLASEWSRSNDTKYSSHEKAVHMYKAEEAYNTNK